LLNDWRSVIIVFILKNASLVDQIPSAGEWTLAKLSDNGVSMLDTCNMAQKLPLLIKQIRQIAYEKGWNENTITLFEGDCRHHHRNVWRSY
jgi:hypothetical protein